MAPRTSAYSKGDLPSFDPSMHFRKGQADSCHLISPLLSLSLFPGTTLKAGGGKFVNKFPCPGSAAITVGSPQRNSLTRGDRGEAWGWRDLRDQVILWKGHCKASWKPEGWGGSICRLSFIYLSRHAAPGVLPGQRWRGRDNNLLVLQISFSLPPSLLSVSLLCPLLLLSHTLTL